MVSDDSKPGAAAGTHRAPWWIPSASDLFFAALLYAAFGRRDGWLSLLADADCGWHIRAGEHILRTGSVPWTDLFSFSRPDAPWFAWEWLSDVLFALLFRAAGLPAVVMFCGLVIGIAVLLLWCWILRRGYGLFVALPITLAVASASTVHYLARPHVFSILFFTIGLWILSEDRRKTGLAVWVLVPMTALWANLHGGFIAWPATVLVAAAVDLFCRNWAGARRYAILAASSAAATVANPYGIRVHAHIFEYLSSSWISNAVQEFQSPQFRAENTLMFGLLLVAGLLLVSSAFLRRERFEGVLLCLWACAALRSARHIPLYSIAAAPVIAGHFAARWKARAEVASSKSLTKAAWQTSQDLAATLGRPTPWLAALAAGIFAATLSPREVSDFPASLFPAKAVSEHTALLRSSGRRPRILTTDQWADYLIFRLYPNVRVFFDGRSDFYGAGVGNEYRSLMRLTGNWRELMKRHDFDVALLPVDWPLREILEMDPSWRKVSADTVSVLFVRTAGTPVLTAGPSSLDKSGSGKEGQPDGD